MASFLWITDPWDTLDHPRDTTLRLAEEALNQGHTCHWADVRSLRLQEGKVLLDAVKIEAMSPERLPHLIRLSKPKALPPDAFRFIHYRTDPPVDLSYLHPLQLLSLGVRGNRRVEVVNPLEVLFSSNEKMEGAPEGLLPRTLVSLQEEALNAFLRAEGKAVLKPLHQAQSKGVELLDWSKREFAREKLKLATDGFQRPAVLQQFLPEIAEGEKRLWFVDGKLLATIRKLPLEGDFRVNLDAGSRLAPVTLTAPEKKSATRIAKLLRARKIRLAAVDLIANHVTDFNFTSPGLIPQMESLLGENLAKTIIRAIARKR